MIRTMVTGGTGFVGSGIVKALIKANESVHVLTRNPLDVPQSRRVPGAHYVSGDVFDPESLKKSLSGCDALIHCVQFPGAPFEYPKNNWTYDHVDGAGTEAVVAACQSVGLERLIYMSGMGAGQDRPEPWFKAKDRAEAAVKSLSDQWTIFRPSWIYGPQDQSLNKLISSSRLPLFFPIIGDGLQSIAPLFIEDLAATVAYALNRETFYQKAMDLGGPEVLSFNDMMTKMLEVLGRRRKLLHIPKPFMKTIGSLCEKLPTRPPLTSEGIDFLCMDVPCNLTDIQRLIPKHIQTL